jgi:hypothetical protein
MAPDSEILLVPFTRDEALELFNRCLRSLDEDNERSAAVLRKLAEALRRDESEPDRRVG